MSLRAPRPQLAAKQRHERGAPKSCVKQKIAIRRQPRARSPPDFRMKRDSFCCLHSCFPLALRHASTTRFLTTRLNCAFALKLSVASKVRATLAVGDVAAVFAPLDLEDAKSATAAVAQPHFESTVYVSARATNKVAIQQARPGRGIAGCATRMVAKCASSRATIRRAREQRSKSGERRHERGKRDDARLSSKRRDDA